MATDEIRPRESVVRKHLRTFSRAVCLVGLCVGCGGNLLDRLRADLFDDCSTARLYFDVGTGISSNDDIPAVFQRLDEEVPAGLTEYIDAKIFLVQRSVECGCLIDTDADYFLALLLLEQGDLARAIPVLESNAERDPRQEVYERLAEAHESIGNSEKANEYRAKARATRL